MLSNSLGTDWGMWDAQAAALSATCFVLRHDTRGHRLSGRGAAPVTLDRLTGDPLAHPRAIGGRGHRLIPASHISNLEAGEPFTHALVQFLAADG